jgi:hypothetical protein
MDKMMKSYEPTFDEDGVPWASPEIQRDYEFALGGFMLAFNRLDNMLTAVLETSLIRIGRLDLVKSCIGENYARKILIFDLLKHSSEGPTLSPIPILLLAELGAHRNKLAHGHFEQNPFSGDYEIIAKSAHKYSPTDLNNLAAKANKAWDALRLCEAIYAFSDLSLPAQ